MQIEQLISYQIENQFPSIYKEQAPELIALVKAYYQFLETQPNQSVYNARRLFDYRDIDTTLSSMLLFYKNTYLNDVPFNETSVPFIVKHITDFYRRRGSEDGLKLFFRLFYQEDINVYYPAEAILKPSASTWKVGKYIELFPQNPNTLKPLIDQKITGSISKAQATVDKINFILLNGTIIPVIFLSSVKGTFKGFDDILATINGITQSYGRVTGSLDSVTIVNSQAGTTGNNPGDILTVESTNGIGGKLLVKDVTTSFTGQVNYTVVDGGFGYTTNNTELLVSDQSIILNNPNLVFNVFENLQDQSGNTGIVIGQSPTVVGVRMNANNEFTSNSIIQTIDRGANNFTLSYLSVTAKNDSSPGPLYPIVGNTYPYPVQVDQLSNIESVSLITDVIGNYLNVTLNATNYNLAPALVPMSGNTTPTNINTPLDQAFNLTPFKIGTIVSFKNINPGADYINDVFAIAYDPVMANFNRPDQVITLQSGSPSLSVGSIIYQNGFGAKIRSINSNVITVTPFTYYGFNSSNTITYNGLSFTPINVVDYYSGTDKLGYNSTISAVTEFKVGKILTADVISSGFGYVDGEVSGLIDASGNVATTAVLNVRGEGTAEGYWSTLDSQLNYTDGKVLQDSYYYQTYSYEIQSKLNINNYQNYVKTMAHMAGTKMFGEFYFNDNLDISMSANFSIVY